MRRFVWHPMSSMILVAWLSAACGSSNEAPLARVNGPAKVQVGGVVELDGSKSSDPDGDALTYAWSLSVKPAGSSAALDNAKAQKPRFTADVAGSYQVSLVVSDGEVSSATAHLTVVAEVAGDKPVAHAGDDRKTLVATEIELDGSLSSGKTGVTLSYTWSFLERPQDSNVAFDDANAQKPKFTPDKAGAYKVQLIVNDGTLDSDPAAATITAEERVKPVSNAGDDREATVGFAVELDGSASTASGDLSLTFKWTLASQPTDSTAALDDDTAAKPKFTPDKPGDYEFELVVNDGSEDSDAAKVKISVVERSKPVAKMGEDREVTIGDEVALDGSASEVSPGLQLSFDWTLKSKPAESTAVLDDSSAAKPKFTADKVGEYKLELVVNDGTEDSELATLTITAVAAAE